MTTDARRIDLAGLDALIILLDQAGWRVLGPTVRDGAIDFAPVHGVADLARGVGDDQAPGRYRLREREDDALFAYAAGAQSVKPVLFPADQVLWRSRQGTDGPQLSAPDPAQDAPRFALLGVRPCDLRAIALHDTILLRRAAVDVHYAARRDQCLLIAVTCTDPAGTCFCTSMGGDPKPDSGYDLALTELYDDGSHRFVVEAASPRGADLLEQVGAEIATADDVAAAARVAARARERIHRTLPADEVHDLLYANTDSPRWEEVATRCLACTNCTLVCPTCFCTTITDTTDLHGEAARHRVWDSCFSREYSYIHGGSVRESVRSRYRQWITHKLASWQDQFGTSGCVGCGRCIAWCPAGIDLTAEVAALHETSPTSHAHR